MSDVTSDPPDPDHGEHDHDPDAAEHERRLWTYAMSWTELEDVIGNPLAFLNYELTDKLKAIQIDPAPCNLQSNPVLPIQFLYPLPDDDIARSEEAPDLLLQGVVGTNPMYAHILRLPDRLPDDEKAFRVEAMIRALSGTEGTHVMLQSASPLFDCHFHFIEDRRRTLEAIADAIRHPELILHALLHLSNSGTAHITDELYNVLPGAAFTLSVKSRFPYLRLFQFEWDITTGLGTGCVKTGGRYTLEGQNLAMVYETISFQRYNCPTPKPLPKP